MGLPVRSKARQRHRALRRRHSRHQRSAQRIRRAGRGDRLSTPHQVLRPSSPLHASACVITRQNHERCCCAPRSHHLTPARSESCRLECQRPWLGPPSGRPTFHAIWPLPSPLRTWRHRGVVWRRDRKARRHADPPPPRTRYAHRFAVASSCPANGRARRPRHVLQGVDIPVVAAVRGATGAARRPAPFKWPVTGVPPRAVAAGRSRRFVPCRSHEPRSGLRAWSPAGGPLVPSARRPGGGRSSR